MVVARELRRRSGAVGSSASPTLITECGGSVPTTVTAESSAANPSEVCIAGSFNEWHPAATPMISLGDGKWAKELALPPGRYEYRFVVDGQWADDPSAKETAPNPFGKFNAVLIVQPPS